VSETKAFTVSKQLVMNAYRSVKANRGGVGVDQQSLEDFGSDLKNNLYQLWNRMSSGSYFPPPVKAVSIPKRQGGERILGVPTVADRVAQMVVKLMFEPQVEAIFLPDSYGYRPGKSALDAVGVTRKRCWERDWVLEFDIKGLFDNIPHDLLLRAVRKHTADKMVLLYVERWLVAPMQGTDGTLTERTQGTPQGGVVSPILSNLFLHYVFDVWMKRNYPGMPWCRYADDGLVHCRTESQALEIRAALGGRFAECGLELHPKKTKIVYCKDGRRKGEYSNTEFDFLGYSFRARLVMNPKDRKVFVGFTPGVSKSAMKSMRAFIRKNNTLNRTDLELHDIAKFYNPTLRGWIAYYGRYYPSALQSVLRHFNLTLVKWVRRKYRRYRNSKTRASRLLTDISRRQPELFAHWKQGMVGTFI
jgi:RNA-directed DNA polymerase